MNAAGVRVARMLDASIVVRGVVVLALGDGSSVRATVDVVEAMVSVPFERRLVAYDVDAAGNRYNVRPATATDHAAARGFRRDAETADVPAVRVD